ncbi:centromere protein H [Phaenicophaeus curvirostris]|uniref:centromere protein H n=1 Tax=Phaenicophaeus curvirostris TaxID=33595 RepID=UPI0037F09EA8
MAGVEGRCPAELRRRLREELPEKLPERGADVGPSQERHPRQVTEENLVLNAIQDLQRRLDEVKISLQNKTLALQRIQLRRALENQLEQNNNESQEIMETLTDIVRYTRALTACEEEVYEKEQKLIDLRKKRFSLKKTGKQKMLQLRHLMKRPVEQESVSVTRSVQKLHDNLQKERELTTIIQTVFQIIVMASNTNWAEDPSLKEAVLKLETNTYLM